MEEISWTQQWLRLGSSWTQAALFPTRTQRLQTNIGVIFPNSWFASGFLEGNTLNKLMRRRREWPPDQVNDFNTQPWFSTLQWGTPEGAQPKTLGSSRCSPLWSSGDERMAQQPTAVIKTSTLIEVRKEEEEEEEGVAGAHIKDLKEYWGGWLGVTGHRMLSQHNGSQHIKARVQKHVERRYYKNRNHGEGEGGRGDVRAISSQYSGPLRISGNVAI